MEGFYGLFLEKRKSYFKKQQETEKKASTAFLPCFSPHQAHIIEVIGEAAFSTKHGALFRAFPENKERYLFFREVRARVGADRGRALLKGAKSSLPLFLARFGWVSGPRQQRTCPSGSVRQVHVAQHGHGLTRA